MSTDASHFARLVHPCRRTVSASWLGMVFLLGLCAPPIVARAATFTVNSKEDIGDATPDDGICATVAGGTICTLRAAIQQSNALAGLDTIKLPANTYTLTSAGSLAISDDLIVTGSTTGPTIIGYGGSVGLQYDRVFDVIGPAVVTLSQLIIENGSSHGNDGGGIRNDGVLTLSQVAMINNQSNTNGGAIANFNNGTVQLTNVTLANNTAAFWGGAIANFDTGLVQLTNVTISGNKAFQGGGISNATRASRVQMYNSILANNSPANCYGSAISSLGFNLDDGNSCFPDGSGDLKFADPKLVSVAQDYGGYTITFALLPGSPAIDAGDNTNCPSVDQRGFPRPIDGNGDSIASCDIGAFELQPNFTPTLTPILTATPTFTPPPTLTATVTNTVPPTNTAPPTQSSTPTKIVSPTSTGLPVSPTPTSLTPTNSPTPSSSPPPTTSPTNTEALPSLTPTATRTATPRGPGIVLGMASGHPGEQVSFSATFDAQGVDVGSEQSEIGFDVANAPIAVLSNGTPNCTINPDLSKLPSFSFIRSAGCHAPNCSCTGTACTAVRAAVLSLSSPIGPLPDGVILYSCRVSIAANAVPGEYPLAQVNVVMSDPLGLPISNVSGGDGVVVVLESLTPTVTPTETTAPTATPTTTPSVSPTATPTLPLSPTPTKTIVACVGDCDGSSDVTVNELVTLVNIALGNAPLSGCVAGDADHSGDITIDELLRAVNNALSGCPSP